jgi:uncharacterized protein
VVEKANIEIILDKLKDYIVLLKNNRINYEQVYLYGSYGKGNPREDSDIDIAIIAEKWDPDILESQFNLKKIARKIDIRIEPRPIIKADIIDPDPFISEIIRKGKLIYS